MTQPLDLLTNGKSSAQYQILLAHGAGAPMDSPFMEYFAQQLAARGHHVVRFEFPYMAQRRRTGGKRPPDREPILRETWHRALDQFDASRTIIGGKSMGGRIASMVADELGVVGLVCLGYPFHPPGKPEKLRVAHLEGLRSPTLILQGERDALGRREEVSSYTLSDAIQIRWLADGDHSFKPRRSSGHTEIGNWQAAVGLIDTFVAGLPRTRA